MVLRPQDLIDDEDDDDEEDDEEDDDDESMEEEEEELEDVLLEAMFRGGMGCDPVCWGFVCIPAAWGKRAAPTKIRKEKKEVVRTSTAGLVFTQNSETPSPSN